MPRRTSNEIEAWYQPRIEISACILMLGYLKTPSNRSCEVDRYLCSARPPSGRRSAGVEALLAPT